jgi:predicted ATPase with chaperone activity
MNFKISFKTWLKHSRNIIRLRKKAIKNYEDALKMIQLSLKDEMKKLKFVRVIIDIEEFTECTSEEEEKPLSIKV